MVKGVIYYRLYWNSCKDLRRKSVHGLYEMGIDLKNVIWVDNLGSRDLGVDVDLNKGRHIIPLLEIIFVDDGLIYEPFSIHSLVFCETTCKCCGSTCSDSDIMSLVKISKFVLWRQFEAPAALIFRLLHKFGKLYCWGTYVMLVSVYHTLHANSNLEPHQVMYVYPTLAT